jgi:hypothetical protein
MNGTEGQDRESYSDDQDRESYSARHEPLTEFIDGLAADMDDQYASEAVLISDHLDNLRSAVEADDEEETSGTAPTGNA